jgi:Lanthionine synthetase C-like protein
VQESAKTVAELVTYVANTAARMPSDECEVLYGRAGLLYALLFVERTCPHANIATRHFQKLIIEIVAEGHACGARLAQRRLRLPTPRFMHEWHKKPYLGAAHGTCGILHARAHAGVSTSCLWTVLCCRLDTFRCYHGGRHAGLPG